MARPLEGRGAPITGSTGGLGETIAAGLAEADCNVVLNGLGEPEAIEAKRADLASAASTFGAVDAASPVFAIDAAGLWRTWIAFAARQPRTVLRAQDERRSLQVQRSAVLRFPDLVRGQIVALGAGRSGLVLASRARFGFSDLGVSRRRVSGPVHDLHQVVAGDSPGQLDAPDSI